MPPRRTPPGQPPTGRATIDVGGALDALLGGASQLIQQAYLRKSAKAQAAREQQAAAQQQANFEREQALREDEQRYRAGEGEREQAAHAASVARIRSALGGIGEKIRQVTGADYTDDYLAELEDRAPGSITKLLVPTPPARGTPAALQIIEDEAAARRRGAPAGGGSGGGSELDRQIDDQQQVTSRAEAAVPRLRPIPAQRVDQYGDRQDIPGGTFDPAAERAFVSDSTAKAATAARERGTLDNMRRTRGDLAYAPPAPSTDNPNAAADDAHRRAIAAIRAQGLPPEEEAARIREANQLYREATGAAP